MEYDDARQFLVDYLKNPESHGFGSYGYEYYLPNAVFAYVQSAFPDAPRDGNDPRVEQLSPIFLAVAWDLCRQGIIRPGVKRFGGQTTSDGASGYGYSLTPYGKEWLAESDHEGFVTADPTRFARMIAPFVEKLGPGFAQRASEANRCYFATAYLACCAMCGAAAESILLAAATAKTGKPEEVVTQYRSRGGRTRVENILVGDTQKDLRESIDSYMGLLKYWRDEAAHGIASEISELQAHEAMARLLRFAQLVNSRWKDLTHVDA